MEKVIIGLSESSGKLVFNCNRWLDEKEDDGQIERDLYPDDDKDKTDRIRIKRSGYTNFSMTYKRLIFSVFFI